MTAIDHHSMIGDSTCANSTIAKVKCAFDAAVGALVVLQKSRLIALKSSVHCLSHISRASGPQFHFGKQAFSHRSFSEASVQWTRQMFLLHLVCEYRLHSILAHSVALSLSVSSFFQRARMVM